MRRLWSVWASILAPVVAGCGGGTAIIAGGGSSGGGTVATTVSDIVVSDTKNSPAEITFTLRGQTVSSVLIEYLPPLSAASAADGGAPEPAPIATLGADQLQVSPSGASNVYSWLFAGDLGSGFTEGLGVRVSLDNGTSAETSAPVSVGNSPPHIVPFSYSGPEVVGVVGMLFTVEDTDDTVTLGVEVNVDAANDFPEGSWETASPDLGQALVPFVAAEAGTTVSFHWNPELQHPSLDSEVRVRATAVDTADPGEEPLHDQLVGGGQLFVDNNEPPVVDLDSVSYVLTDDQRLGIVVPYTVSDPEGDTVDLVFQWTREGEPFPDLPSDEQELQAILDDPAERDAYRIATPYPIPIAGRIARPGLDTVELPELASSQAGLLRVAGHPGGDLAHALDGLDLELLRSSNIPEPLAATWPSNPLNDPVAALPTAAGTTALVLDHSASGQSRLREIDLATGGVVSDIATSDGEPDTMVLEHGDKAVLFAEHVGSHWRLVRVNLESFNKTLPFDVIAPGGESIRGLVSVGTNVALATIGGSLLRLDYSQLGAPQFTTLLDGLATPWGLALDPLDSQRVYLAERDGGTDGRVLAVELDTHAVELLPSDVLDLHHPERLAFELHGARLIILTDAVPFDGLKELRALELGGVASSTVTVLSAALPETTAGFATGDDGLRLLALGGAHDLAAGGGVVQRRTIVGYDPTQRVATVAPDFDPPPEPGQPWRPSSRSRLIPDSAVPYRGSFAWDSGDLPGGHGAALLRLTARDADPTSAAHDGGKPVLSGLQGLPVSLGNEVTTDGPQSVAVADIDGDGDKDLVSANAGSDTLTVFFQTEAGVFDPVPLSIGSSATTDGPNSVAVADIDGDGDKDLVSANSFSDTLSVFFQIGAGAFEPIPLSLGDSVTTDRPGSVAVADIDGDGDMDLVSTNFGSSTLSVFFQIGAGVFDPAPLSLGGLGTTFEPVDVAVADVDGDGDMDLVSANQFSDTLTVFFQFGAGAFEPIPLSLGSSATTNGPRSVAVTDVDGDGSMDLVSANGAFSDTLTVFFQIGAGVFDPAPLVLGSSVTTDNPHSVAVADVDGDGDMDLVSANGGSDTLTVFFQTKAGVFDPAPLSLGHATTIDPAEVDVADIDGDGDMDLVSANNGSDSLAVFLQTEAGVFDSAPLSLGSSATTSNPFSVAAADVDGDGGMDLVSANPGSSTLTVLFQLGAGVFDPAPLSLGHATAIGPVEVDVADVDGDGDMDLVSANSFSDTLSVFFQIGAGAFEPIPLSLGDSATTDDPSSVAVADVDGDGNMDLVSANFTSDTLRVFFQTEAGVFDLAPLSLGSSATTNGPTSVEVADVDGDGDMDLVSANQNTDTLSVFFQIGGGAFEPIPLSLGSSATTDGPQSVAAADIDGDGDRDLVSANLDSDRLTVFFQTRTGVFEPTPLSLGDSATTSEPISVAVADVDGDGDMDLVSANRNSNTLSVLFQIGAGVFDPAPLVLGGLATTLGPGSVAVADVDADGDMDLISANNDSSTLTVFFGSHSP